MDVMYVSVCIFEIHRMKAKSKVRENEGNRERERQPSEIDGELQKGECAC